MAEHQQYPLPNPGLPLGQQAVSPVAQTNPLQSLQQGGVQGFSLGLAARQQAALEQERQTQLMAAQAAIKQQQQKNLIDYSTQLDTNLKNIADIDHGMAVRFYKEKVLPLHNEIGKQYGLPEMDPNAINSEDNTPKELERISTLYHTMISDPQKAPFAQAELNDVFTKEIYNKHINEAAGSALKGGIDFNKHQDELMNQEFQRRHQLRSDPLIQQVELKQSAAGSVYDQLRRAQDDKGKYNISAPQLVDLYANLYRAQSGVGITGEALPMMDQKTAQGNYAKVAAYFGLSKNALPQELGDRLLHMSEQLGHFNEIQHQKLMEGRDVPTAGLSQANQKAVDQWPNPRGLSFTEMKKQSDESRKNKGKKIGRFVIENAQL